MNARIERYKLEPEGESNQVVENKGTLYAPGPQPEASVPHVPVDLLEYLKRKFPNELPAPPVSLDASSIAIEVAKGWGHQEVIKHLGSIITNATEK